LDKSWPSDSLYDILRNIAVKSTIRRSQYWKCHFLQNRSSRQI